MVILGMTPEGNPVELTDEALAQGAYVIGTTGTGKTTLLVNIGVQHMNDPRRPGLCVLDPHGDMIDDLLELVPEHRKDDVLLFSPGDRRDQYDYPLGLNILDCNRDDPHERELVSSTVIGTLYKLFSYSWGPRMEDLLRNTVLALMERPETTLLDMWIILASKLEQGEFAFQVQDPFLWRYWVYFAGLTDKDRAEIAGSSLNKIGRFLGNPIIRNIVGQPKNAFDVRKIMDSGGILLVNLSKGELGEDNSALLGSVLVNLILIAALKRRDVPPDERRPFHLIVDEYQSFATKSFPTLQSEARKYGITVTVAHQYRDQLDDDNKGSTMNVGNFICLRVSGRDSMELANQFDNTPPDPDPMWEAVRVPSAEYRDYFIREEYDVLAPGVRRLYGDVAAERANALSMLPNHQALCRLLDNGMLREYRVALAPVEKKTITDQERRARTARVRRIRQQSRERGRDRRFVEAQISKRLAILSTANQLPDAR